MITLDKGFKNTGSCESAITFLDGEKGILRYRGYAIEDLAEKASFLEVSYLLIFGELPTRAELTKFHSDIKSKALVDEEMKKDFGWISNISSSNGSVVSSNFCINCFFNPKAVNVESEEDMYSAIVKILAKFPVLVAWTLRKKQGMPLVYSDNSLGYVQNLVKMMFQSPNKPYQENSVVISALNKL